MNRGLRIMNHHGFNLLGLLSGAMLLNVPYPSSAGQVIVWGDNAYGETNVPANATVQPSNRSPLFAE